MAAATLANHLKPLWPGFVYKPHQLFGVQWMLQRERCNDGGPRGGILADEMGLGKTIQMAALIKCGRRKIGERVLLVTPVAVLEQWKSVLNRAGLSALIPAQGAGSYSWTYATPEDAKKPLAPQVHILGYERLTRNSGLGRLYRWDRVIFDEAHRLHGKGIGEIAKLLRTDTMWLLTATPIVNKLEDITNLLSIVGVQGHLPRDLDLLAPTLKRYILARSMEQLRNSIPDAPPPPSYSTKELEFKTEEEGDFYRGMTGIIARRWKAIDADMGAGAALERLKLFMRLRQLSLHPQVYIGARKKALGELYTRPDWEGSSTKFDAIYDILTKTKEPQKWIIFCHFHEEMNLLRERLTQHPNVGRTQLYHGGVPAPEKEKILAATHEPTDGHEILIIQLQSGGVGLNLQHFTRILFSGPWWTKALMEQAVGRAVRIGQKSVVEVTHLVLKEEATMNIDAYMNAKADEKGSLCKKVLEEATRNVHTE